MRKRMLSFALALALCLSLLPATALAAENDPPDWYFLFAIFKNVDADGKDKEGKAMHAKYAMTQEEIDFIRENARQFEEFMSEVGVMRAHVDVVEIDASVTELADYSGGSWLSAKAAAPLLKGRVDLDKYDHVFCVVSLNTPTTYLGLTGAAFENGTGHSCINLRNREYCQNTLRVTEKNFPPSLYVHEFLHFMDALSNKWGEDFDIHLIGDRFYAPSQDVWKTCYTDAIRNRVKGDKETGTGVPSVAWQYPPHVLRTMTELTIPTGVTGLGNRAFLNCAALRKVTISSTVADIGYGAFIYCTGLTEAVMLPGVARLDGWVFGRCTALTKVTIPASVTSIGECAFYNTALTDVYYGGTEAQWKAIQVGEHNEALTKANIHYSSTGTTAQPSGTAVAAPTNDRLTVDGKAAEPTVYKIDGSNYFKIRDVAALLNGTEKQFAVGYDNTTKSATATTGQGYNKQAGDLAGAAAGGSQTAAVSNDSIYVDGEKIDAQVYKIGGSNYFKLRDLGKALNFYVGWSKEQGMFIETDKPYSE